MPKKETPGKNIRITLVRSAIGYTKDQKATVKRSVCAECIKLSSIKTRPPCAAC